MICEKAENKSVTCARGIVCHLWWPNKKNCDLWSCKIICLWLVILVFSMTCDWKKIIFCNLWLRISVWPFVILCVCLHASGPRSSEHHLQCHFALKTALSLLQTYNMQISVFEFCFCRHIYHQKKKKYWDFCLISK